jgi:hypothetical protein
MCGGVYECTGNCNYQSRINHEDSCFCFKCLKHESQNVQDEVFMTRLRFTHITTLPKSLKDKFICCLGEDFFISETINEI